MKNTTMGLAKRGKNPLKKRGINLEGVLDDGFNRATDVRSFSKSGRLRKFGISLALIAYGKPYMPEDMLGRLLEEIAQKYQATAAERLANDSDEDARILELDTCSCRGNVISVRVVTSRGSELPFAYRTLCSLSVREKVTGKYDCEPIAEDGFIHRILNAVGRIFSSAA